MKSKYKFAPLVLLVVGFLVLAGVYLHHHLISVLQPAGAVAGKERDLIILGASISVAIVVPVFGLLGYVAWKYRESNHKAKYTPTLGGSKLAETIWWIVPSVLIVAISIVTWQSSYALDPFKPLSSGKTLHIQVVALDWKWLFIYPGQNLAAVNEVTIPANQPVDFEITSDSVMTSFWVPQLAGQMYAMPGMTTHLNVVANKLGSYHGSAANISGKGFADMTFTVHAIQPNLYGMWASAMRVGTPKLTQAAYTQLAKPSTLPVGSLERFGSVDSGLFDNVVMKYMMPMGAQS